VDGLPALIRGYPDLPVALHPADRELYDHVPEQARAFGLPFDGELPEPSVALAAGDTLRVGECELQVRFTPGHAPGHVILVAHDEGIALVGDVVFHRSIGRTDLPGGDFQALMRSIRDQVLTLPDATRLFPGHGPPTTVGGERMGNPFLLPATGGPGAESRRA
jgi:hydroxyacylglutathione hydrolase